MCGIAGQARARHAVDGALIEGMCDQIVHRGPDSRGTFVERNVGLGVQRLAIIDLTTGDQPVFNEDRNVVVVLNGEIYNYTELRDELLARGHRFSTRSDTEVIVHLYEELGARCVERLRGMYAFALWDRREERLLLARDRVGKKPLFYALRDGTLTFASEVRALLEDREIPRDVNLRAIASYLLFEYVPDGISAFNAVRKLPAAHTLTWQDGQVSIERYWKLAHAPSLDLPEAEAEERIREALLESTRLRLRSDVPLGALLSGGVDSSAIVAAMARTGDGTIHTFSIGFTDERYDETPYAREVADLYGTKHEEFILEPHAVDILPRLVRAYGEPFADQSAIPSLHLSEMTRRHVTVALNGDGGDEAFAGYPRYYAMELAERLRRLPHPIRMALARAGAAIGPGGRQGSLRHRATRLARAGALDTIDRYAMWVAFFDDERRFALFTPELNAELASYDAAAPLRDAYASSDAETMVERLLDVDVQTYLVGDLLVKMDIASMTYSLEVRSPFLDHELLEFVARLPTSMKLRRGETKYILKRALRPWLPEHLLTRTKRGFSIPLADWFRDELRSMPEDVLLDPHSLGRGWFREETIRALISEHRERRADHAERLWSLLVLEMWARSFVDVARHAATPALT
jgi:asparagine synthase (glutamine-hydrolysing)